MYSDSTWQNRFLVPMWVIHLIFLLISIGVVAVGMMEYAGDHDGKNNPALTAFITLFTFALVMSPLEMVLHSYHLLEPWLFVALQAYKSFIATIFPIIEIVKYTSTDWSTVSSWLKLLTELMIAITICAAVAFYGGLVYGSVVLHRHRKSGRYDTVLEKPGDDGDSLQSVRPSTSGEPIMAGGASRE